MFVALLVSLTGCTDGADAPPPAATDTPNKTQPVTDDLAIFYEQSVEWTDCDGFDCTSIDVPLDYADPTGDSIELALIRRRADERAQRIGSLLVNPGGPGVSGIGYAQNAESYFTQPILDNYDIVGWDPRGVGESTAVGCLTDEETDSYLSTDGTPDTAAEIKEVLRLQQNFTKACEFESGKLVPHVGTFDSARDIDIIREVLGEGQTDYFGASYGTELGATYAELFPERVGRMVLDGALDPSLTSKKIGIGQLRGFQRAVSAFIQDCISRDGCPIGPTEMAAEEQIIELLQQTDASPLPTDSDRSVTEALAVTGMVAAMYDQASGWPALRIALARALGGDGSVLLLLADSYSERNDDGTYASNVNAAFPTISCTDRPDSASVGQIKSVLTKFEQISPIFGRSFAWAGAACANWPVDEGQFPQRMVAKGSAPILVVGTTRDPATPYEWSVSLAQQLDAGVLLSRDGDGHTAYNSGNRCIDETIEQYLVADVVPDDRSLC